MSQIRQLLPSLNTLVAFEAAVRCGTFARAAKELGVTSPAVSRTIGRLELHLGLPLFRRTPNGAVLTDDGNDLFSVISRSFEDIESTLITLAERNRSVRRPVVMSVSAAFATHWYMPRLAKFQARFPGEQIQFQLINGPLEGPVDGIDIAMRFDPKPDERHDVYPLMPELLMPVRAPHYEGAEPAGSLLPAAARMITLSGSQFHWSSLFSPGTLKKEGQELLFSDYTLVVQAALVGHGIAVGWLNVVSSLLAEGALVPASPTVVPTGRRCDLVLHKGANALAEAICDWMSGELREDVAAINGRYSDLKIEL